MEDSVDAQAKSKEYKDNIDVLDKEITKVRFDVELISSEVDETQKPWGQSDSLHNEISRIERANNEYLFQIVQMKKELAEKLSMKREIEDWLDEKVQIEFQIESGRARVRALNDELITNSKAFDREKYTLQTLIKKKNVQMDRVSGSQLRSSQDRMHMDKEIPIGRGEDQVLRQQPTMASNRSPSE